MKLTKRAIDGLKPDASGRDVFVWDDELKGFGVRMKPSGAAAYLIPGTPFPSVAMAGCH